MKLVVFFSVPLQQSLSRTVFGLLLACVVLIIQTDRDASCFFGSELTPSKPGEQLQTVGLSAPSLGAHQQVHPCCSDQSQHLNAVTQACLHLPPSSPSIQSFTPLVK